MNHARLLTLLNRQEAPAWFVKSLTSHLFQMDYGQAYESAAQSLWNEIRLGHADEDIPYSD